MKINKKVIKWIAVIIVLCLALFALIGIIAMNNKESLAKLHTSLETERTDAQNIKNVASIKYLSLSIMLFQNDKNKLPTSLAELDAYTPIVDSVKSSNVMYTVVSSPQESGYKLCAPYGGANLTESNHDDQKWSISGGLVCLFVKQ